MLHIRKLLLSLLVVLSSCASFNTQVDNSVNQNIQKPKAELSHRFYLVGDAGNAAFGTTTAPLNALQNTLNTTPDNTTGFVF